MTEPRVIINPWTAELHKENDKDIPSAHYQALFWGVVTEHRNVPLVTDKAKVDECLRGLHAQPGKLPGGWLRELYDDFYKSGSSRWGLPHFVTRFEAEAHIKAHLSS